MLATAKLFLQWLWQISTKYVKFGNLADTIMFIDILEDTMFNKAALQFLVEIIHSYF